MTTDQHPTSLPTEIHSDELPTKMKSSLQGTSDRILDLMQRGQKGIAIVEYECTGVGFKTLSKATAYVQDFKLLDLFPLPADEGRARLRKARSEHRVGMATSTGEHPLPDMGDVGYTDASGVVLTAAEVADMQGRGQAVFEVKAAVIEYSDGSKAHWPDDYAKGVPRPAPGDPMDDDSDVVVVSMVDAVTGEPIEVLVLVDEGGDDDVLTVDPGAPADPFDDPWEDPEPASSAAGPDPAAVDYVACGVAELKMKLKAQTGIQWLEACLVAEAAGGNRASALDAIEKRLTELRAT